jgi:hypothetical protein
MPKKNLFIPLATFAKKLACGYIAQQFVEHCRSAMHNISNPTKKMMV